VTDSELNALLRNAQPPPRTDEYWQEFPRTVWRGIARGLPPESAKPKRLKLSLSAALVTGLAAVCLLVGFWFGTHQRNDSASREDTAQARKLVAEIGALFPHQVQAIVIENGRTELRLSEKADVPDSAAVLLRICDKTGCEKIITFSGQQVRINGQWCDVLVDSGGHVIVAGPRFVWSTGQPASSGAQIEAKALEDLL
jgi:hypothetical protein